MGILDKFKSNKAAHKAAHKASDAAEKLVRDGMGSAYELAVPAA